MRKTQHLVLTRFNLKLTHISAEFAADKNGKKIDPDDWLRHRFDLFEHYCLPSMAAQANKDFLWLLFFDEGTSSDFRERIEQATKQCPQIRVVYLKGAEVYDSVMQYVESDTDVLITTRLDNDDAFHDEALQLIRQQADQANINLCINLRFGYSFNGEYAEVFSQRFNPFSSLVEHRQNGPFKTIFGAAHGKIHQLAEVKQILTGPYWLIVIHDRNVANRSPGDYRAEAFSDLKSFKRFIKKYILLNIRRLFWPAAYRKRYKLSELQGHFHIHSPEQP